MSRPGVAAAVLAPLTLLAAFGCQPRRYPRTAADAAMFGAQAVRIHPTFTRAKDWTGDGEPDGVEAVLELLDEFGEPTRATGRARFEMFQYRQYDPDPRGKRNPQVWEWSLASREEQSDHWSRALRAYSFKLPFNPGQQTVVLAATFALDGGTPRLFDQIILEPSGRTTPAAPAGADGKANTKAKPDRPRRADRRPATQPSPATAPAPDPMPAPADAVAAPEPAPDASPSPGAPPAPAVEPPADAPAPAGPPAAPQPGE